MVGGRYPSLQHSVSPWYILHSGKHWLLLAACLHCWGHEAAGRVVVGNFIGVSVVVVFVVVLFVVVLVVVGFSCFSFGLVVVLFVVVLFVDVLFVVVLFVVVLFVVVLFVVILLVVVLFGAGVVLATPSLQHDGSPLNSLHSGRHFPSLAASLHWSGHFTL